jgi:predicted transcriptional regulator
MYKVEEEYERYTRQIGGMMVSSNDPSSDIKKTRMSLGITQKELGALMNLRRETISRIENGAICPTFDFIKRFSKMIAATKVIRDLRALEEVYIMEGKNISIPPPSILRIYFKVSLQELKLISDIGIKGYQKSRTKIIKKMKEGE